MRGILISLLLLNVAYFGWQLSQHDKKEESALISPFPGKQLVLLSEEPQPIIKKKTRTPTKRKAKKTTPRTPKTSVKKQPSSARLPSVEKTALKRKSQTNSSIKCYAIGPFTTSSNLSTVATTLENNSIPSQQRAGTKRQQVGHWVYIPPEKSLQAARKILRDLKQKKINKASELMIIAQGERKNAVSVGVRQDEALATTRQQEVAALGYKTQVTPIFRTQPQYWLDIELPKTATIDDKLWRQINRNHPDIELKSEACDG